MITYAVEPLAKWRPDAEPMLIDHWRELADFQDIPLDVSWDWYEAAEKLGSLVIYAARDDGRLVGYALFVWRPSHPHYKNHAWAVLDIIWVDPNMRGQGIGTGLADFFEAELKKLGVSVVQMRSKTKSPELGNMLSARGYRQNELAHTKRL